MEGKVKIQRKKWEKKKKKIAKLFAVGIIAALSS